MNMQNTDENEKTNQINIPSVPEELEFSGFLLSTDSQLYPLRKNVTNIGRSDENDIVLPDPYVSRQHGQIRAVSGRYIYYDLGSSGGSKVNNERASQATLSPGDLISIGRTTLIFGSDDEPDSGTSPQPNI